MVSLPFFGGQCCARPYGPSVAASDLTELRLPENLMRRQLCSIWNLATDPAPVNVEIYV